MGYKVEIKLIFSREAPRPRNQGNYAIHRVDDDGADYVCLIGNEDFMQKLSDALKKRGFG